MTDTTRPYHWGRKNENYAGPSKASAGAEVDTTGSAATGDFPSASTTPPWEWDPVEISGFSTEYLDDCDATVVYSRYVDGVSPAIQVYDTDTGEALCTASVALDEPPREGHVFIKNWSENAGVLEGLQKAGVIGEVTREVPSGFVMAKECRLIPPG